VIVGEVYPLFRSPAAPFLASHPGPAKTGPAPGDASGVDEYREIAYAITAPGAVAFTSLTGRPAPAPVAVAGLDGALVSAVGALGKGRHLLGTTDGRVIPVTVALGASFTAQGRTITTEVKVGEVMGLDPERRRPVRRMTGASAGAGPLTVAQVGDLDLSIHSVVEVKALVGASRREESVAPLTIAGAGEISALALDGRGEHLFVGTSRGRLLLYDVRDRATPLQKDGVPATGPGGEIGIATLGFLIGDRTLVVGDAAGRVSTWQALPPPDGGGLHLTRIHDFAPHEGPVVAIAASARDKGFVTADAAGHLHVHYATSGQTLLSPRAPGGDVRAVVFAPKADGLLALDGQGSWSHWRLDNPHPEVTLRTMFGKVWYEGYTKPEYVWQSTGGTDDFEAKLSLTPLIFGTLKGTLYALLFAVPMALLAAVYVSEFMHPTVKGYVKPVVEIMAALPSVVLGFLAGLWLAPMVERVVPGLFLLPAVLAVSILTAFAAWRLLPASVRGRFRTGSEVIVLIPVVLGGTWLAFWLGGVVEITLLGGSYRAWLLSALGLTYDQRNSLVVGVAMGFAVIPIIFTIAEDSLANVPQHLRAGSLALGANRWQTALRIVLPTASPGIFSAVMIGFGRAVGETMIVLMATGNTPLMDWSIFNGIRTLSANIAVEIPEAPHAGTLYRTLFLTAALLFALTFIVNTVAEIIRQRLRDRYRVA
jgi:phosphate transport system permease protein